LGFSAFGGSASDVSVFVDSDVGFTVSGGFVRVVRGVRLRALPRVVVRVGFGFGAGLGSVSFGGSVSDGFASVLASSAFGSGGCVIVAPTEESRLGLRLVVAVSELDSVFSATGMPPLNG
jgi:hypothetical protein